MAILYKTFKPARTALYACLTAFFLYIAAINPALAQYEPLTVENVTVDVSADNALNARNQAFEKAQQQAFATLAAQFLNPAQASVYQPPEAAVISPMIQDYEVTQEKLSSKRYIGTYTFRFKTGPVRSYFGGVESQVVSVVPSDPNATGPIRPTLQAPSIQNAGLHNLLILPFYQVGQQTFLWSAYNGWMQAWRRLPPAPDQALPVGDLSDVNDVGDGEALSYSANGLARILSRYEAREAVIIIAIPDISLSQVNSDSSPATGSLKINVFRTDRRDGPEQTGQIIVAANPSETRGAMLDRAARQVQQALLGDWKNTSYVPEIAARNTIEMRVPFANLQEWAMTQRALNRVQGIDDIVLKSLTPREARIGVVYEGSADTLRIALQQAGMNLSDPGISGAYELSATQGAPVSPYMPGAAPGQPSSDYYAPPGQRQQVSVPAAPPMPPPPAVDDGTVYDPVQGETMPPAPPTPPPGQPYVRSF